MTSSFWYLFRFFLGPLSTCSQNLPSFFIVAWSGRKNARYRKFITINLDQLHPLRFHQLASSEFAQTELSGFWIPMGISWNFTHIPRVEEGDPTVFLGGGTRKFELSVNGEIFPFKSYQLPNKCAHIWLTEDHHIFKQQHYCQSGCFCGEQPF